MYRQIPLKSGVGHADTRSVERKLIGFCALLGGTFASFIPTLWGGSEMGLSSLFFGLLGGIAGIFIGARLAGV